jgi:hypothetical protein
MHAHSRATNSALRFDVLQPVFRQTPSGRRGVDLSALIRRELQLGGVITQPEMMSALDSPERALENESRAVA